MKTKRMVIVLLASILTALLLAAAASAAGVEPVVSRQNVVLKADKKQKTHVMPMYYIDGSNYIKLRDFAVLLNGTKKRFDCAWRPEGAVVELLGGRPYTTAGGELLPLKESPTVRPSDSNVRLDGQPVSLRGYKLNGSNFYLLRDLGRALDVAVYWNYTRRVVMVNADASAAEAAALEEATRPAESSGLVMEKPEREPSPNPYDLTRFHRGENGRVTYDGEPAPRFGIDVSRYQHKIDWAAAAADGVEFAMIRVGNRGYTKGGTALDPMFYENVAGARANGVDVGIYFFSQAVTPEEAIEEAEIALRAIQGLEIAYPIVFDWENIEDEARTDGVAPAMVTAMARAFCGRIQEAGYTAGVYFNQVFGYQVYDLSALEDYVLWLAQYADAPDFRFRFELWQFSSTGKIAGIADPVDLNLSFWQKPAG